MPKSSPRKTDVATEPETRVPAGSRVVSAIWLTAVATLLLSVLAMFQPQLRLWAVHEFAFLHIAIAVPILLLAALLLSPIGPRFAASYLNRNPKLPPIGWAAVAFLIFMLFSVHGSLLGDGQLCLTRLAHIGDMIESHEPIPRGRFLSQKEPGTMLVHEIAFRIGMAFAGPDMKVAQGRAGQQARVERQLIYRDIAQWCYRILSAIAGALLILLLLRFLRARNNLSSELFWLLMFTSGGWFAFFGYVENYALVSMAMVLFLVAGLKATEPPRTVPIFPILLFGVAVFLHYVAIVLLPALIYLLWTMHFDPRDQAGNDANASTRRAKTIIASFIVVGLIGYIYVKGWKGWISVLPLLPQWVKDGYALISLAHFVDLVNLILWASVAALLVLFLTKRIASSVRANNQENFLLLAAGASAVFAFTFSPNLGMARDWDIVSAALWPTVFYGAWRLANLQLEDAQLPKLRASLLAMIFLILVPTVLVQSSESASVARFRELLELDRSRSAYGWENLALYYQRTGELDKRIAAWEQAVSVERNPRYLFNLAEAYKLADRIDQADTTAIAAAKLNNEYAPQLLYYAVSQAKNDKLDRARVLVETALEINPNIPYGNSMKLWADRAFQVDSVAKKGDIALARNLISIYSREDSTNSYWPEVAQKLGR